jgi:glycosyltransferase involved in cell wall biosynthesis
VLAQDYPSLEILARDDGSTDGTQAILEAYAQREPKRLLLLRDGESSGSAKENFRRLLMASTAPYVCLCDQDDVWLPHKVSASMQAMQALEAVHGPDRSLLVFSDLTVVDERLRTLHRSFWQQAGLDPRNIHRLRSALSENVVTGCTALLNRNLLELAVTMPPEAPMHDRWIALLAAALGYSAFLREPTVLYRQHRANVIGARLESDTLASMAKRSQDSTGRVAQWWTSQHVAAALLRLHGERLQPAQRRLLAAYLRCGRSPHRLVRVATLLRHGFFRRGWLRNLATLWVLWRLKQEDT